MDPSYLRMTETTETIDIDPFMLGSVHSGLSMTETTETTGMDPSYLRMTGIAKNQKNYDYSTIW